MDTKDVKTRGKEISAWTALGDLGARHMRRAIAKRRENRKQNPEEKYFSLWTEHTPAVEELIAYVKSVTEEGSESYIPPAERLAVTDMDGTLFCETDPTYFDFMLLVYRVLEDPDYKDRATERERTAVQNILSFIDTGVMVPDLEVEVGRCIASSFSGLTVAEFTEYVRARGEAPARGYDGMKAGEAFFRTAQVFQVPAAHRERISACLEQIAAEEKISDSRSELMRRIQLCGLMLLCSRVCIFLSDPPTDIHTTDPQIIKAAHYINEHYMNPMTTADVAQAVGFSPNYLSRKFRTAAGIGLHEYLVFVRLHHAALELISTHDSITTIALRCGFSDSNYFKDSFKKKYGVTSRDYRKIP